MTAATCLDCDRPAKREGRCGRHARHHERREDYEWMFSFRMSDQRIAERLGVGVPAVERWRERARAAERAGCAR